MDKKIFHSRKGKPKASKNSYTYSNTMNLKEKSRQKGQCTMIMRSTQKEGMIASLHAHVRAPRV
jgi:hypothetical protein